MSICSFVSVWWSLSYCFWISLLFHKRSFSYQPKGQVTKETTSWWRPTCVGFDQWTVVPSSRFHTTQHWHLYRSYIIVPNQCTTSLYCEGNGEWYWSYVEPIFSCDKTPSVQLYVVKAEIDSQVANISCIPSRFLFFQSDMHIHVYHDEKKLVCIIMWLPYLRVSVNNYMLAMLGFMVVFLALKGLASGCVKKDSCHYPDTKPLGVPFQDTSTKDIHPKSLPRRMYIY